MLLAGIGILRMPDLLLRMSTTTKAATVGVSSILVATALFFNTQATSTLSLAIIAFLFLTAPVAAHMMARAAYLDGIDLYEKTHIDHLEGHYDADTGELASPERYELPAQRKR